MAAKRTRTAHIMLPGKQWFTRASIVLMVTCSISMIVMSKTNNPAIGKLRTQIMDIAAPILSVIASPMNATHNAGTWMSGVLHMYSENIALKNENIELMKWQQAAKAMEAENESLRTLLNVVPLQKSSYITARVVSDVGGPYVHSALINGGSENGIKKDKAAISDNGLLGRIIDVGDTSSRVLLLNDINSRVPVLAEQAREKSILLGNNTGKPTLTYLSGNSKIKVGERLVTSGDGGVFPSGIPVGVVTSIDDGVMTVEPFVDATKTEYVSIVDYAL